MDGRKLSVLMTLVMMGALAHAQIDKPSPVIPNERPAPAPNPSTISPSAGALPVDNRNYIIGPEDILKITVWREDTLSGMVAVRPDGKITRPLIGDVEAAGLTPERLTAQLREAYKETVIKPEIMVELIQVNSKRFSIAGGVNRPGAYPLIVATTVFQALNDAAGFREFANKKDIRILRADGTILHFNYNAFIKGDKKARAQNVLLQNGDTIIVKD